MLLEQLKTLAENQKKNNIRPGYAISLIKEYLQNIVLEYIYNDNEINNKLVFTGGTCLRFCYGLPRLSEDLDFDCEIKLDHIKIAGKLKEYFLGKFKYPDIEPKIKGAGNKIYLKFPLLGDLGLAYNNSLILLLKVEISQTSFKDALIESSLIDNNNLAYFVKRYSLPDLMAGKIHAFLTRLYYKGKNNEVDFKGRDMFDLVWYMGKNIMPNTKRIEFLFRGTKYEKMPWNKLLHEIHQKSLIVSKTAVRSDLANFIENPSNIDNFMDNYQSIINQYYKQHAHS